MHPDFPIWLSVRYNENTVASRVSNVRTIEECYGSLDDHFKNGTYQQEVINRLEYTRLDELANRPNHSGIQFRVGSNIRNGLNTYKNAARLYEDFLNERGNQGTRPISIENSDTPPSLDEVIKQKLSLERDMEEALRRNIENLAPALRIVDEGSQRAVDSGFIDITCEDNSGLVVVELKAGKADSRAIGQILGYMGDLQEEGNGNVRGILVAHDFDKRTKAAARVVPTLTLKKYAIEFKFVTED